MSKIILALAFALGMAFYPPQGEAMMGGAGHGMGGGMMGGGGSGMGPGGGQGTGPGMMGPGYGDQYNPPYGPRYKSPQKPLDENGARGIVENYLQSTKNPTLHLGKIEDRGNAFEANILTRENSLADKILIDKETGSIKSAY